MMSKRVLHLVRKSSQLNASFIFNQISNHAAFKPYIVFRQKEEKKTDGGFANFNISANCYLDLSLDETFYEKIIGKSIRIISQRQVKLIKQFIFDHQIDICHFHYGTDCGVFYPLQKNLTIPSVVSFYGYDAFSFHQRFFGYGKRYLKNRVFSKVDCVLAMSPEMMKDLIDAGCPERKIVIHYHGVPSKIFNRIKTDYNQVNTEFNLLNISYFDPVKGHIFIFKALQQLLYQGLTEIRLNIFGHGFFEQEMKQFINTNHLNSIVTFLGPIEYGSDEMMNEYRNADIFIHPSVKTKNDKEGIPGAIVEAMFAGLPVISTYHGGIPYVIENEKNGFLVNEWDVDELTSLIKKLMIEKRLREKIGIAGYEYAMQHLDLEVLERELESIYSKLISKC